MATTKTSLERLQGYVPILKGLISYHKRMMVMGSVPCNDCDPQNEHHYKECPKATILNDVYLGALGESLRLIEREIATLQSS